MEHKSKTLIIFFLIFVALSILFSYYIFVIQGNYRIFYSEDEIPDQTDIISILEL